MRFDPNGAGDDKTQRPMDNSSMRADPIGRARTDRVFDLMSLPEWTATLTTMLLARYALDVNSGQVS